MQRWIFAGKLAVLELVVVGGSALAITHNHPQVRVTAFGYAMLAVSAGGYALSPRWPVAAALTSLAGMAAFYLSGYPTDGPSLLGLMVPLYVAADPDRLTRSVALGAGCAVVLAIAVFLGPDHLRLTPAAAGAVPWVAASLLLGHLVKGRRAAAERAREEHAERRLTEERLRIARELHDVVSHSISVINVQAGVAAHVLDADPAKAKEALLTIKSTSKEALRELRGILGVLRQVDDAEPLRPAPGLAQLDVLVQTAVQAGLPTRLELRGQARPLSPAVDLAAYRIVQESLTNALRHAGAASAAVEVAYGEDAIAIEVTDDGAGGLDGGGAGQGLAGMRERAAAVGGTVEAGPLQGRGFRVRARLPLRAEPA